MIVQDGLKLTKQNEVKQSVVYYELILIRRTPIYVEFEDYGRPTILMFDDRFFMQTVTKNHYQISMKITKPPAWHV